MIQESGRVVAGYSGAALVACWPTSLRSCVNTYLLFVPPSALNADVSFGQAAGNVLTLLSKGGLLPWRRFLSFREDMCL